MIFAPFSPDFGAGTVQTLAAAGTATLTVRKDARQVCFTNQGANPVYARIGDSSVANASIADYAIPANGQVIVTKSNQADTIKLLSPAGTTVHVITGEGW